MLYTDDFLAARRLVTDTLADAFVQSCFASDEGKISLRQLLQNLHYNHQLTTLPSPFADEVLFQQAQQLPPWANQRQMVQGTAFFARHASLILNMLGLLSLPYDYAGANGAMVLYLSDRMRNDTGKRLQETGDFVWEVMAPNAFTPEGKGFVSILKVRLIHAVARYYTLKSGRWNDDWGQPVNQEDMAGTNLSFSLVVVRGLRKLDIAVTYADQQAFMHLWNVIGYLSGVQEALLPEDGKQAIALEQAIQRRQFKPSEQGQALAQALVHYFHSIELQPPLTAQNVVQLMRYLIGDSIADMLALPIGTLPAGLLNLLKLTGTLQELKPQFSVPRDYYNQYAEFRRQQPQPGE